ncbi:uncharacterized protein [Anabrus simplex]|uniref:uncharacterized protein n=1 Tax=Anabrus simplex TaxID=316456 RepID=UPI0035A37A8E
MDVKEDKTTVGTKRREQQQEGAQNYDITAKLRMNSMDEVVRLKTFEQLGMYVGSPCELTCNPKLRNVFCDKITGVCECDKRYPVRLGASVGCAKPVRLGEQCLYGQTCTFTDQHAVCTQVEHNAICQCKAGYHEVSLQRPTKRNFCSPDQVILNTDVPTLFGVATGLAIFTGLICFVLKLFSRARYARPRHYANANLAPPILFSSETGSRRPSLASIHSSASSSRSLSFSMRRYERENQQREARAQQLAQQLAQQQAQQDSLRASQGSDVQAPSPSPRTPMSTDELLPSVSESKEEENSTPVLSRSKGPASSSSYQGEIGPCTSSDSTR